LASDHLGNREHRCSEQQQTLPRAQSLKSKAGLVALLIVAHLALLGARYATTGTFVAGDSAWQFATLRSFYMQGSLDLADEARYFYEDRSPVSGHRRLPGVPDPDPGTGMVSTIYPVGGAALRLPPYVAADALARGATTVGIAHDRAGYRGLYQLLPAAFSALAGIAGLLALARVVADRWGTPALLATVTVWLASPIVYYLTIEPLMTHALSIGLACALVALAIRTRFKPPDWSLLVQGALCGLLTITRYQDALFVLFPLVLLRERRLRGLVLIVAGALPFIVLQLWVNDVWYGTPWTTGYASVLAPSWLQPDLVRHLFHPVQGAFTTHPIHLLGILGALLLWRTDRQVAGTLLVIAAVQIYAIAVLIPTTPGASFGNRTVTSLAPLFVLGWITLTARWPRLHAVGLTLVAVNGIIAALYCLRIIEDPMVLR
jgi:hypothetical protein